MKKITVFVCFFMLLTAVRTYAQWTPFGSAGTGLTATRTGLTGVGFNLPADVDWAAGTSGARFLVQNGIIGHYVTGTVGDFNGTWAGIGLGNPGNVPGVPNPYGLSIVKTGNLGFLNLFPQAGREDLVLGFGKSGATANTNNFILRSYFGTQATSSRDLMNVFPGGATSFNLDPSFTASPSTLFVDAARDQTGGPKAIVISSEQRFGSANSPIVPTVTSSVSAIGVQQNASLTASGITVEGFRTQVPTFPGLNPSNPPTPGIGVAANLQVVRSPYVGQPTLSPIDVIAAQNPNNTDYAELTWQDLNYGGPVSATDCGTNGLSIGTAEGLDKFFISFRNNQNVNPFGTGNKLPVMTFQANGRVGIGTVQPTSGSGCSNNAYVRPVLLDVNGLVNSVGNTLTSDRRFKQDIKPIVNAMDLVRRLQGTTYQFRQAEFKDRNFPGGNQYGFIAQDVEKVMPEIAAQNSDGYYAVNYTMLIPVLTEAIKEQDKTVTELRNELAELRSQLNDLKAGQQPGDLKGYRLEQNVPNPTGGNTVIAYALPAGTSGARITVYDLAGRTIKSWPLSEAEGQITLDAGSLSGGLYIYDLQVGGRQVLERKMSVVGKN
ncbi:MAG: tail fiber domain-containing protein [Bacteroidota bacterium]